MSKAPEPCLGVLLGTFGSAFCAPLSRMTEEFFDKLEGDDSPGSIKQVLLERKAKWKAKMAKSALSKTKIIQPAKFPNFAQERTAEATKQRLAKLDLCDSGIDFNVPFPPLLRKERGVDVIIVCNASKSPNIVEHRSLNGGARYAECNGLPFPTKGIDSAYDQAACVLDDDPEGPIIVYFPLRAHAGYKEGFDPQLNQKSGGYCSTFNFDYTNEQIQELSGLSEFVVKDSRELLASAIRTAVERRRRRRQAESSASQAEKGGREEAAEHTDSA